MKKACVASCADHLSVVKAMDAMIQLGIQVVSITEREPVPFSPALLGMSNDWNDKRNDDRFHVFGLAEGEDQIYKLSLDFSVDPQLDPPA